MFEFLFMRRAFLAGMLLALIVPCIGMVVVLKRLSLIGDALSHSSLAGVAAGLAAGFDPVLGAAAACLLAALSIEAIRKKFPRYAEMSIAIILSAGVGLAGILSGWSKNAANFNSYLFGSIVAISDLELWLVIGVSAAVLVCFTLLYKELFYLTFDERAARLAGVPTRALNFIFTLLTAFTVAVAARTVGALIVSSLMVVPVACAMQVGKSYRATLLYAVSAALLCTAGGLTLSFYEPFGVALRPGATIVLLSVLLLLGLLLAKWMIKLIGRGKHHGNG